MAGITSVQNFTNTNNRHRLSHMSVGLTGFAAGAGMALTIASGYSKNVKFKKQHKNLALVTAAVTILHVLLPKILYSRNNF